ncbi:hypothetical protein JCM3765_000059 [Sporobolomyces pararoseus]
MISPSTIISIQQNLSTQQVQLIKLKSIAFASLIPLAGPVLVPVLLDKRKQRIGERSKEGNDELGTPDGTSFVWISVQSLLLLSAVGIAGSLHLGGYSIRVVVGIFVSIYALALFVAWILVLLKVKTMLAATSLLSVKQDSAAPTPTRGGGLSLSSIAFISLVPLAGPVLVPILLDKVDDWSSRSTVGIEEKEELEELEVKDGTNFVWISVESLLVLAALGISGSLKLGGFGNWAVLGFFITFYTIALIISYILIIKNYLKRGTFTATRCHNSIEFELVRGMDEEEDYGFQKSSSKLNGSLNSTDTTDLNTKSTSGYYDSREGQYRGDVGKSEQVEPPKRTISQKLRPFFLTAGAGLKNENAKATDSSESLTLVALLTARQPASVLVAIDIVVPILTGFKIHSKTPINPKSALPSFEVLYIAYGITTGLSWAWLGWAFFCSGNRYRQSQDNKIVGGAVIAGIEESREEEEIGLNILTFDGSRSTSDVDPVKPEGVLFFDEQEITGQASEGAGTLEKS